MIQIGRNNSRPLGNRNRRTLAFPLHRAVVARRSPEIARKLRGHPARHLRNRLIHRRQRGNSPIGAEHRGDEREQNNMASSGSHG